MSSRIVKQSSTKAINPMKENESRVAIVASSLIEWFQPTVKLTAADETKRDRKAPCLSAYRLCVRVERSTGQPLPEVLRAENAKTILATWRRHSLQVV
jgi:hypothetical protein